MVVNDSASSETFSSKLPVHAWSTCPAHCKAVSCTNLTFDWLTDAQIHSPTMTAQWEYGNF